jgi:hypothetical protein
MVTTHLARLERGALEHRFLGVGGAAHDVGAPHGRARFFDGDDLDRLVRHALDERGAMLRARAEHLHASDRPHRADRAAIVKRLVTGAEQAERLCIRARGLPDCQCAGGADAEARQMGLVHEGERLAGIEIIEDDHGPIGGFGMGAFLALGIVVCRREVRACAHAGDLIGFDRAGMDVGVVAPRRVGGADGVAQPRRIDGAALGEIAERNRHRLDRLGDREQADRVVVGNDDGHWFILGLATRVAMFGWPERRTHDADGSRHYVSLR